MKLYNIFTLGIIGICLASCELKDELTGSTTDNEETGALELDISVKQPASSTRADGTTIDTSKYPVSISGTSDEGTEVSKEYTVSTLPASIVMPVGTYVVSSHTPGELEKQMATPYYAGNDTVKVSKDIASQVEVVCSMANSRIQMVYGDDFLAAFSSWTITIDDGDGMALSYTEEETSPAAVYYYFGEGITTITVNITAKTTAGNTVTESRKFKKSDATQSYEEEGDEFTGGDALVITMGTVESSTGTVTDITINASITFEDSSESVEIPTTDEDADSGTETDPGTTDAITISEPEGNSYLTEGVYLTYGTTDYPSKEVTILMGIDNGIKSLAVKVSTTNTTFETAAGLMGLTTTDGLDLTSDAAAELKALFTLPQQGDTSYTFTLNETLLSLLMNTPGYIGTHTFNLTVTDLNDQQASATLTVYVTETES